MALRSLALPALAAAGVLGAWAAASTRVPEVLLPSPLGVARAAWETREALAEALLVTGGCSLAGLGLAVLTGLLGALLFQLSRSLELALTPYALLLQTLPIIAVAPLLVVWLGYGPPVAIASGAIVAFFPILTSASLGLSAVSTDQEELFAVYGASRTQELLKLRLPAALPVLFGGLRTAAGLSVIGVIVGEFVGSTGTPRSLGYLVQYAARSARTDRSFAAIFAAALLALLFFGAVRLAERLSIGQWHGR